MNGPQCRPQLDIPHTQGGNYISLDHSMPGWLQAIDYVFFNIPCTVDKNNYDVVVEALDTSGPRFRKIGPLDDQVRLPHVMFDPYARIGVLPRDCDQLPRFESRLTRGGTYSIPKDAERRPLPYYMKRTGVDFF